MCPDASMRLVSSECASGPSLSCETNCEQFLESGSCLLGVTEANNEFVRAASPELDKSDAPSLVPTLLMSPVAKMKQGDFSDVPSRLPFMSASIMPVNIEVPTPNIMSTPSIEPFSIPTNVPTSSRGLSIGFPSELSALGKSDAPSLLPTLMTSSVTDMKPTDFSDVPSHVPFLSPSQIPLNIEVPTTNDMATSSRESFSVPTQVPTSSRDLSIIFPIDLPALEKSDSPSLLPTLMTSSVAEMKPPAFSDIPSRVPFVSPSLIPVNTEVPTTNVMASITTNVPTSGRVLPISFPTELPGLEKSKAPTILPTSAVAEIKQISFSNVPSRLPFRSASQIPVNIEIPTPNDMLTPELERFYIPTNPPTNIRDTVTSKPTEIVHRAHVPVKMALASPTLTSVVLDFPANMPTCNCKIGKEQNNNKKVKRCKKKKSNGKGKGKGKEKSRKGAGKGRKKGDGKATGKGKGRGKAKGNRYLLHENHETERAGKVLGRSADSSSFRKTKGKSYDVGRDLCDTDELEGLVDGNDECICQPQSTTANELTLIQETNLSRHPESVFQKLSKSKDTSANAINTKNETNIQTENNALAQIQGYNKAHNLVSIFEKFSVKDSSMNSSTPATTSMSSVGEYFDNSTNKDGSPPARTSISSVGEFFDNSTNNLDSTIKQPSKTSSSALSKFLGTSKTSSAALSKFLGERRRLRKASIHQ